MLRLLPAALLAAAAFAGPALAQSGPLGHRLFLAPTSAPVEARRVTVGVSAGIIPHAGVGLGRGVSLDAHAFPSGFAVANLKAGRDVAPGVRLAAGLMAGRFGDGTDFIGGPPGAVAYGVATLGSDAARVNVLAGVRASAEPARAVMYGCPTFDEIVPSSSARGVRVYPQPVLSVGTDVRVSPRVRWISEVAAVPEARTTPSTDPRISWPGDTRTGYGTVLAGTAARLALGRVAVDAGVVASSGRAPGASWGGDWRGPRPFPWVGVGVGL